MSAVIKHKEQDYDLSELGRVLAPNFLHSVIRSGNQIASNYSLGSMHQIVKSIRVFGEFLADHSGETSRIPDDLRRGLAPVHSYGDWLHFLNEFRNYLQAHYPPRQVTQNITWLNALLPHWAGEQICPAKLKLSHLKKQSPSKSSKNQSILQVTLSDHAKAELEDFARESAVVGDDDLSEEAKHLLYHIAIELDDVGPLSDINAEQLQMMSQAVLERRLERIYSGVVARYKRASGRREEGNRLIERGKLYMREFNDWLTYEGSFKEKQARPILNNIRALSDEDFFAGLLAWCYYYHEFPGLHPFEGQTNDGVRMRIKNECSKYRRSLDVSADAMIEYLGASRDLLGCGYLLILFETIANPESIIRLKVNSKTDLGPALSVVDWVKPRAKKVLSKFEVYREFGLRDVIDSIAHATGNYRQFAIRGDEDSLFLHAYSSFAKAKGRRRDKGRFLVRPNSSWFNDQTKRLTAEFNDQKWVATAKQIRASIILLHSLKFGVKSAQEAAGHSTSRTTMTYTDSLTKKLQIEHEIREFLEWLQVLVTINVEDIPAKLGIAEDAYNEIAERMMHGFGGAHCSDPYAGYQPGSEPGKPCNQIMMCMLCEKRRNLFIASESNVEHLLQWRDALTTAMKEGTIERGNVNWVLWETFLETMHQRLAESPKHKGLLESVRRNIACKDNPYHRVFARG